MFGTLLSMWETQIVALTPGFSLPSSGVVATGQHTSEWKTTPIPAPMSACVYNSLK